MTEQRDFEALHKPVLLQQVLDAYALQSGQRALDCTLGMGGHTLALLEQGATVTGIERDPAARVIATERLAAHEKKFNIYAGTFADAAEEFVRTEQRFDFILADLGVSSLQLDAEERGFGIRSESPLDMRMGDQAETALDLIRRLSEEELANVIYQYGEERLSRKIAPALQAAVAEGKHSGKELAEIIRSVVRGHQKRHPALRTFQGLRIAVNDELGQLEVLLAALPSLLNPGGVGVVISFHSLEDRLVKNSYRDRLQTRNKPTGLYSAISKRVVTANAVELHENNRAHSAKLRWAQRSDVSVTSSNTGNQICA